ncbi:MAG: hypothetical protein M0D55_08665 [Elusimicrobiota bacterium]|nr:MAG: hypothetical protein M0D55_08665 [Elusimicrobiota bacterium]
MRLLALAVLLLAPAAAADDGVSVEYLSAPRNEALWMVESWHKLPRGFRVEPSVTLFRAPGGSVMHRSFGADVGWEPSRRWDLSAGGGVTAPRDGYRGHHGGFEGTFLVQERAAVKAGLGATFTSHVDERLGTSASPFRALETSIGATLSAELAGARWTARARKSLYDRSLPKAAIDRYAGFAGGGPSPAHYSPSPRRSSAASTTPRKACAGSRR